MFQSIFQFFVLGLGSGAVYVLAAQGLVVIHRGSGVINFANGGFALVGAYAEYELTLSHVPEVPAILIALVICGIVGALTNVLMIQRLKNAAQLTKLIATLGLLELITGLAVVHYQSNVTFPSFAMPNSTWRILNEPVGEYYVLMFVVAVVATSALWAFYKYSAFGLKTSAVAENPRAIAALGHSPDRLATWNWALGAALAGLGGILIAPIIGLSVTSISLLLIPSLASALLGNFSSFSLTFLGGMLIGVAESEVQRSSSQIGLPEVVPLVIVVIVLMLRGSSLPSRGFVSQHLPKVGSGQIRWTRVIPAFVLGVVICLVVSNGASAALINSLAASIILLSTVVVIGYAGQLSLAQLGMAGIGAFLAAQVAQALGLNFWEAMLIGVVGVIPFGILLGLPALRTRGVNLAIVTLAFGVIVSDVIFANPGYTNGSTGTSVQTPFFFGINLNAELYPQRYAVMVLVFLVLCGLAVLNLRRGSVGRQLIAVRDNERAAATLGISVARAKLYAFALAASIATIGGVLIVYQASNISWASGWDVVTGITLLSVLVIGGVGYVAGSIPAGVVAAGGVATYVLSILIGGGQAWIAPITGFLLIVAVVASPDGVIAQVESRREAFKERRRRRAGITEEAEAAALLGAFEARARSIVAQPISTEPHALSVKGLTVRFGGLVALDDVHLEVKAGEVVGLIGPNGAGKTTLIDAVTGITRRYSGHISLDEQLLDDLGPTQRARLGLTRSFQALELFDDLTVEENVRVGADRPSVTQHVTDLFWPVRHELPSSCVTALKEFDLGSSLGSYPRELSFGRRRLVGIVRAVAAGPKIVLLDEPAAGLDQRESREMVDLLRNLAQRWNLGILLVEHDMTLVMNACDRITVLDFGQVIASGPPGVVRNDPAVIAAYLGVADIEPADQKVVDPVPSSMI